MSQLRDPSAQQAVQACQQIERVRPLAEEGRSLQYAASEIVNDAIDHSGGGTVEVSVSFEPAGTTVVTVRDDGVAVFRRVCTDFGL